MQFAVVLDKHPQFSMFNVLALGTNLGGSVNAQQMGSRFFSPVVLVGKATTSRHAPTDFLRFHEYTYDLR